MDIPLKLHDVTLILIDTVCHELSALAIEDTLRQIEPAETLIWTDDAGHFPGRVCYPVEKFKRAAEWDRTLWYEASALPYTSHMLVMQYDGWVLDAERWNPAWLEYDYIGAPWPWQPGRQVGNGGFSLRSTKMMRYLADNRRLLPLVTPEDATLCRGYAPALEERGFRFAPVNEARTFSFERGWGFEHDPEPPAPSFGFHGLFNFPHVLSPDELTRRMRLAPPYVRGRQEWRELMAATLVA